MKLKALIFLLFIQTYIFSMSEPYQSIKDLPFDDHGWFYNAKQLNELLNSRPFYKVIEIGSWLGCSTRFIASRLPKDSKLYAVDTWKGWLSDPHQTKDPRISYLYQLFLSNVKHAGLTEVIIPIRMESTEAAKALNIQADLIYLDAAHDTESVYQDIMAWYPHLQPDGVMCGDDWWWPSVQAAVAPAAAALGKQIYTEGNFWRFY